MKNIKLNTKHSYQEKSRDWPEDASATSRFTIGAKSSRVYKLWKMREGISLK